MTRRFWYSPIYKMEDYGFYIESKNSKYFLGYKHKDKRRNDVLVKISKHTYGVLKKEWR